MWISIKYELFALRPSLTDSLCLVTRHRPSIISGVFVTDLISSTQFGCSSESYYTTTVIVTYEAEIFT